MVCLGGSCSLARCSECIARRASSTPRSINLRAMQQKRAARRCGTCIEKLGCSNLRARDREVAHRIIGCTPWATRCGSHSGAAATRACRLDVARLTRRRRRSEADHTLDAYRVHIQCGDKRSGGPCLSYWCMVPGVCMRELQADGIKCIVLTSGTLSPLESFAHELVRIAALRRGSLLPVI